MTKLLLIPGLFLLAFFSLAPVYAGEPQVAAKAAIVIDAAGGQILYAKSAHTPMPPASTTKIMTALLAVEEGDLEAQVVISPRAAAVGEASIYLQAGETLTLEELIKGALIPSGNDAAWAIAEEMAGSVELFAVLMNRKAFALGAFNTNFVNPNGLPAVNHYTSAYDLALMARKAMDNPKFREVVATRQDWISYNNGEARRYLKNTNRLLWSYPGADGVKTGTTREAGSCLVASASQNGRRLIAVVLNSTNRYGDAARLLDYGFTLFLDK